MDPSLTARPRSARPRMLAIAGLGLVFSVILMTFVLRRVELRLVWASVVEARPWPLVASLGTKALGFAALAWRAGALLRPSRRLRLPTLLRGQLLGFAANNLVPFRIGELAKVDYVARHGRVAHSTVLATAAVERLLDLICMAGLFVLVAPFTLPDRLGMAAATGAVAMALGLAVLVVARRRQSLGGTASDLLRPLGRVGERLQRVAGAFLGGLAGFGSPLIVLEALVASSLYWLASFLGIWLWLVSFAVPVPWYAPAIVLVFLVFGTALPASPGYLGTYHYFFVAALDLFAVDHEVATSVAIVGHFMAIVPFTVLAMALVPGEISQIPRRVREVLAPQPAAGERSDETSSDDAT